MPNSSWTETGTPINLVPTSTTIDPGQQNSPDYLTNADKIAFMAEYRQELATKTQLDTAATSLGIPTAFYDSAVANINASLTNAGAPANWATIWPDGTTFGPSTDIQTTLSSDWAGIATARASLQNAISATQASQQAAAAQAAAIAAAATDAATKMNTAVTTAQNLAPVVVSSLPTLPNAGYPSGKVAYDSTDGKLYTNNAGTWKATVVGSGDISGTLSAAQIASLAASQVTGQLSDAQLAAISAAKVTGTLADAQIAGVSASKVTGTLSDAQLAAISAAKITGAITSTQITDGAISTAKIAAGAVTASQIAADTITAAQIAAGAITASELAVNAVTAASIAAATITGSNIAAGTITGSNLVADTITATQIAASAVTSSELAAGAVVAGKIAAGTIQAADIAAGTITGDRLAANTVTASQIAANTITSTQIAADTITAGQIAAGAIGASEIAAGAITVDKLTVMDFENQCLNPGFETGVSQWGIHGTAVASTAYARSGTTSLKLPAGIGGQPQRNSNAIPVVAGQVFLAQAWYYIPATLTSGGVYIRVRGLNAAGTETFTGGSATGSTVGAWTLLTTTQTIPAGVVSANFEIVSASPVGGDVYVDDCYFRRCNDASLIVDGTITAAKIASGAITADMITTGTLNAANVAVTNLNASNITTGTLSASKVLFGDGTALTTASRVQTLSVTHSASTAIGTSAFVAISDMLFTEASSGPADTFNIQAAIAFQVTGTSAISPLIVAVYVDGTAVKTVNLYPATANAYAVLPFFASINGLAAGSHTIQFYAKSGAASGATMTLLASDFGTYAICQRIY
jgi:hypothetical protein